jgi:hypothetical protein
MNKKLIFLITILALVLAACSAQSEEYAPMEMPVVQEVYVESERVAADSSYPSGGGMASSAPVANTTIERLVIKNASLSIAVDDPEASMDLITALAEELGGYVVSAYMYQTTLESGAQVPHASVSIRIPAERLDEVLETIKAETTQPLISENIDSQDVTADYVDLSSRLTNLEATEEQLQQIMDEAVKTEDVLAVYSQLTYIREQIEVIKGQMKYYEEASRLSMVSVELIANEAVQPLTIGGWQPEGVAKSAVQALINTVKFLAEAGIWIVIYILPVALLIFGPPALIVWAIMRRRAKRRKANSTPPAALIPDQKP